MNFKSLSLVASSAIIGSVFMTGCFFSTSTDYIGSNSSTVTTRNVVGLAAYISGGQAFADCNNNLILDKDEESHDVNDKGEVSFEKKTCNIVFIGGKNSETNQSIPYPTVAPKGFNHASPITTLLVDLNETEKDAFIKSLGLNSIEDVDIDYNVADDNASNKVKAFKTLVEVVLTTVASKVDLTANKKIFTTITKAVAEATIEKGSGQEELNLTNPTIIESLGSAIVTKLPSDLQQDVNSSIAQVKDVIVNVAKDGNLSKAEDNISSTFKDKIAQANSYIKVSAIEINEKKYPISNGQFGDIDLNATEDIEELLNSIKLDLNTSSFNQKTVKMVDVYLKVTQKDSDRKLQVKVSDVNITKDKIIVPADAKIKAWAIKTSGNEVNANISYGTDSEYKTNNINFTDIFNKLNSQTNVNLYDINSTGSYDVELLLSGIKVEGLKAGEINLDLANENATGYKVEGTINIGIVSENSENNETNTSENNNSVSDNNETNTSENNNSVSDNNGSDNDQNQSGDFPKIIVENYDLSNDFNKYHVAMSLTNDNGTFVDKTITVKTDKDPLPDDTPIQGTNFTTIYILKKANGDDYIEFKYENSIYGSGDKFEISIDGKKAIVEVGKVSDEEEIV